VERLIPRDEREAGVDRGGDRVSYLVLSFGILAIVAYRSIVDRAASWDLLALVVLGGLAGTAYRARNRAVSRGWLLVLGGSVAVALVVAAIVVLAGRTR